MARLAFVSTAHIHAKPFIESIVQATDGRVLHAVWDEVPARGRRHADLAHARFEPDLDRLVRDPGVDGFVICSENTQHLSLLRKVLPAHKPILCEKPLVTTRGDAVEVAGLVQAQPGALLCGYFLPYSAELRAVGEMLAHGVFGQVTRIRIRNSHFGAYGHLFDPPDLRWFTEPARSGGGAFMDVGAHAVHLARSLFGPVTEVWAEIGNHSGVYPSCDDFGIAHLRFASGVLGTIEAAWTQTGGENGLEVIGSERSLWQIGRAYVTGCLGRNDATPLLPTQPRPAQIDRLVAAIRGELTTQELQSELTNSLDTVAIMEACYASAAAGRWESVAALSASQRGTGC